MLGPMKQSSGHTYPFWTLVNPYRDTTTVLVMHSEQKKDGQYQCKPQEFTSDGRLPTLLILNEITANINRTFKIKCSWNVTFSECDGMAWHFIMVIIFKQSSQDTHSYEHLYISVSYQCSKRKHQKVCKYNRNSWRWDLQFPVSCSTPPTFLASVNQYKVLVSSDCYKY